MAHAIAAKAARRLAISADVLFRHRSCLALFDRLPLTLAVAHAFAAKAAWRLAISAGLLLRHRSGLACDSCRLTVLAP